MANIQRYHQRQITRSVFRAYDIRGIIGEQLDEDAFYSIGKAISCRLDALGNRSIFIARDGRLSSESLALALKQGLLDSGIHVIDLGAVATPVMYFATHVRGIDNGLMVTGSHNPADYNGIKMVLAGRTLAHGDIDEIFNLVESRASIEGVGLCEHLDIAEAYSSRILGDIKLERSLKVVVDCGNGIAGPVIVKIIKALGCDVIPLYCDVDGRFPNHHPDPSVESNLADLKAAVTSHQADIGLAFDGDADRLGVVTERAETIWPDRFMMMYAHDVLRRNPGATIVYDVKCTANLAQVIENAGGIARMSPTGHSLVKRIMKEEKAALAGEMSGHIFFKDRWYGFDDALYSACRLLEIVSQFPQTVGQQFDVIPNSVNTPEIKIPISDDYKFDFMHRFCNEAHFDDAKLITIDGLRVEFKEGWGLLRASNTSPCLVARFEAEDDVCLNKIQRVFKLQMNKIDANLDVEF
jgi:phosphomannomutase